MLEMKLFLDFLHSVPSEERIARDTLVYDLLWIYIDGANMLLHLNSRFVQNFA